MKAIVRTRYGSPDVMTLAELDKPVATEHQVLISVRATSLNAYDWHMLGADPFVIRLSEGYLKPRHTILGADVAGQVEAVGGAVTGFRPGDEVYGTVGFGGLAGYVCAREHSLSTKPQNLSFGEAAAVPMAALTALQGLRDQGQLRPGQAVLIHGASGGVGTFAVQIARALGAEVTAVTSTGKVEQARQLGAHHVIDYTREEFSRAGRRYDLVFVANGNRSPGDYNRVLTPTGIAIVAGGSMSQLVRAMLFGRFKSKDGGKRFKSFMAAVRADDLKTISGLIEAGKVKPVIDRCYPLRETPDAMRYLIEGHARGKIVINVGPETA